MHLIKSSKSQVHAEGIRLIVLLEVPWLLIGATVLRERSYRQLVARQSRPGQESSWRFRIDLAYVRESAFTALSATSHGLE